MDIMERTSWRLSKMPEGATRGVKPRRIVAQYLLLALQVRPPEENHTSAFMTPHCKWAVLTL